MEVVINSVLQLWLDFEPPKVYRCDRFQFLFYFLNINAFVFLYKKVLIKKSLFALAIVKRKEKQGVELNFEKQNPKTDYIVEKQFKINHNRIF